MNYVMSWTSARPAGVPAMRDAAPMRLTERRYADGETIFLRGDPGDSIMVVLSGRVALRLISRQGREILLGILGEGEMFGEVSALDGRGRSADAVALGDCRLQVIDGRDLRRMLKQSPEACLQMMELLTTRLRRTSDQLEGVALLNLSARLARLLLALSEAEQTAPGRAPRLPRTLSQRDLGLLIGASRSKVNVQIGRWLQDGTLSRENGALVLRDRDRLAEIAETEDV
ncbi:Crp/Fnr family transcriptional regulator [Inquilinus limosus]|uniref:Crp/Fnr family transcriptional regulator n=1 Tax=Inquilinus limosus TaxID=171674 RepID=UPI0004172DDD|nr:Crp/Fnr family transcriptional regulator [Inquilinus limosus]